MRFLPWVFAAIAAAAQAGPYGPFGPDEDYVVALDACASTVNVEQDHPPLGTADFSRAGEQTRLRLTMAGIDHYEAQVLSAETPLGSPVKLQAEVVMPLDIDLDSAICDDLNRDGATDFVVSLWRHGNGFSASEFNRLIALSSGAAYRFWVVPTLGPSAEDFVTFGQIEPLVMVTCAFVQKRDWPEEPRSYFVYDLWAFHGGDLVLANTVDSRFPKWVRYTSQPNWKPALSVTEEDKHRLRSGPGPIEATP